jgi:O-antigen/teichoic acid export membrane protein
LSRGGLALLLNTVVTGSLGFVYWVLAARQFSTAAVGTAGALVSATALFASLGQLNLTGLVMRYLPTAGNRSGGLVLRVYLVSVALAFGVASVSLLLVDAVGSADSVLRLSGWEAFVFLASVVATVIFTLQDSVLIALRKATWVPVENGLFGVAKIALLGTMAAAGTAFALYGAWMIPLALTIPVVSLALWVLIRRRSHSGGGLPPRAVLVRFAATDAAGGLFTQGWTYLLPVIVASRLGPSQNALFYAAFLFSSTIDQIAANFASSLTVEGAHSPAAIRRLARQALWHSLRLTVPVVVVMLIAAPWLLELFGPQYEDAVTVMRLLLLACIPKVLTLTYYAVCRVEGRTHRSSSVQFVVFLIAVGGTFLVSDGHGVAAVGGVVLAAQLVAAGIAVVAFRRPAPDIAVRPPARERTPGV